MDSHVVELVDGDRAKQIMARYDEGDRLIRYPKPNRLGLVALARRGEIPMQRRRKACEPMTQPVATFARQQGERGGVTWTSR